MDKKKIVESVLRQIKTYGIANEVLSALMAAQNEEKFQEVKDTSFVDNKQSSRTFDIYYDNETKEAVGVVYGDLIVLKQTSETPMPWGEAEAYCRTVVINGIAAELFPILPMEREGPSEATKALAAALAGIGAVNLDSPTWCQSYKGQSADIADIYAWYLQLGVRLSNGCKFDYKFFVRPVLRLKK